MRGFRDRDFLSTREGFLFCVVGPYHPADRVISYLKYVTDPEGKWKRGEERFRRVMQAYTIPSLLETFDLLKNTCPHYLFSSSVYGIMMTAVPLEYMMDHFRPEAKLEELRKESNLDALQEKVVRITSLLSNLSGVPTAYFGVTGSILLDIHDPAFSDMDITVYGVKNSYAVKDALARAYAVAESPIRRFEGEKLDKWYATKTLNHPISLADAKRIYERKWNLGTFENTLFSVHPVKLEGELTEKYGDKIYQPADMVTARVAVVDSEDSIFLPAVYRVGEVEGKSVADVEEVASYEGLYDSLAEEGEKIEVRGKLEHVIDNRTGRKYDRILVGSPEGRGREYVKPL